MPNMLRFDCFEVDIAGGQVFKRGNRINLREKSFQVLVLLIERPGSLISREEFHRRLWREDVFVDFDNNLNAAVARLRDALGDSADRPRFIETLPKRGYRFLAEVSEPAQAPEQAHARKARLAVIPFVNMTGDPQQDYLSEGLTDELTTALAAVDPARLAVIARTTAIHYKGSHKSVSRIGSELGVDYVVEGSVRQSGSSSDIDVHLIQVSDQTHLSTSRYRAKSHEITDAVRQAAETITAQIGLNPNAGSVGEKKKETKGTNEKSTESSAAFHLYLQGRHHLSKRTPESIFKAKECFEQSVAQDPDFALAHCSLSEVYWHIGFFGFMVPREAFTMGVWSALRAIEIEDSLAEAHTILGMLRKELDYEWPEVHREMRRALELNPWSPTARLWYAVSGLMPLGCIEEAIAEIKLGLELDPLSADMHLWLALMFDLGRQYEQGLQEAMLLIEHIPSSWFGPFMAGHLYRDMKMYDQATSALRKTAEMTGGAPMILGWFGQALVNSGNIDEANSLLRQLQAMSSQTYVPPTSIAWIHIGLGEIDSAFEWMDRAVDVRDTQIIPIKTYPFLDSLRTDPRFIELLRKMGLDQPAETVIRPKSLNFRTQKSRL